MVAWNIEWYPGKRRFARGHEMGAHAALVKAELERIDPDIFLAQEMRDWESFANLCDAVPGLRPVTVSAFPSSRTGEYWNQQVAIASKLPVFAAWSQPWDREEIQPSRGFSAAAIRIPGGIDILLVYSLHLKSNLSNSEEETLMNYQLRNESIRQVLTHIREMEENIFPDRIAGVVVGGDFNTNQEGQFGDEVVKLMLEAGFHHAWEGVPKEDRLTWRGSDLYDATTFDHFFTKGLGNPKSVILEVPEEASDHRPVQLTIQLPPSGD